MLSTTGVGTVLVVKDFLKKMPFLLSNAASVLTELFFGLEVSKQAVYN